MTRRRKPYKANEPRFEPAIRRNWGYWDGCHARERGRPPMWAKGYVGPWAAPHFDPAYKEGFLAGWEGEEPTWKPSPFTGQ